MKIHRYYFKLLFHIILIISFQNIPKIKSLLTCPPDFKSQGDNYSSRNDPQDNIEYFYGYEFTHKVGSEYYDHWKGVYWDSENFCYDAYNNKTRPSKLSDLDDYKIKEYNVYTNLNDVQDGDNNEYIILEHDQSNLINFHRKMCMTKPHEISQYNNGELELLIKMDKIFEDKYITTPHHFYFSIENPFDYEVAFSFKVRNFIQTIEEMSSIKEEWVPDPNQCKDDNNNDTPDNPDGDDNNDNDETDKPCEKEKIKSETLVEWTEEYPIPEVFYISNKYNIEPHKSMLINISLTFEKDDNTGGYYIISGETGKSDEPFYWPGNTQDNGKIEKLTNLELILESDLTIGISSFALMRRRQKEDHSYLGEYCNVKSDDNDELSGKCGDGYYCNNNENGKCVQIPKKECKNYDRISNACTECFLISVDEQWNPPGGKGSNLKCDLDYIDITKVKINNLKKSKSLLLYIGE